MMRGFFRLMTAMTGWIAAATVLAPRAAHGGAEALPWLEGSSASGVAHVRFVNGLAADVAVEADDHLAFSGVEFRRTSRYAEVGAQRARFVLRAGDGRTIASVEDHLDADQKYTLVAGRDAAGDPMLIVLPDRNADQQQPVDHGASMYIRASY